MDWASLIGSLLGSVGDMVTSHFNRKNQREENALDREFNAEESAKQREFQSKEAEDAYERQVEFYDTRQSPAAMMQQYEKAGVNPAIMYGGSSPSPTVPTQSAPQGSAASVHSSALPTMLGVGDRMISFAKSIEEIRLMKAQAREETSKAALNEIDALTRGEINNQSLGRIVAETKKLGAETSNIEESTRLVVAKIATEEKTVEEKAALIAKYGCECGEIDSRRQLNLQYIEESIAQIRNLDADTEYKRELAARTIKEALLLEVEMRWADILKSEEVSEIQAMIRNFDAESALKERDFEQIPWQPKNNGWNRAVRGIGYSLQCLVGSWWSGASIMGHYDVSRKPKHNPIGFKTGGSKK